MIALVDVVQRQNTAEQEFKFFIPDFVLHIEYQAFHKVGDRVKSDRKLIYVYHIMFFDQSKAFFTKSVLQTKFFCDILPITKGGERFGEQKIC